MSWPPCGSRACPVAEPTPDRVRGVRTTVAGAGARTWYRGGSTAYAADMTVPGAGDTRFAPLPDTRHVYIGATLTVAVLESALHEASGPDPTIYLAGLAGQGITPVELTGPVRFADLRDDALTRLDVPRAALVDTTPAHYACSRAWAEVLHGHRPGGYQVEGILWHSRQADLHARANPDGLAADLVRHQPAEVAVIWHPHGRSRPLTLAGDTIALVDGGRPARPLVELSALIGVPIE